MSRLLKGIIFALASLAGLLIIISVVLYVFFNTSAYRSGIERIASEALGAEVLVGGKITISFFPDLHIKLRGVRVRVRGMDIVSVKEAVVRPALLPLFKMEVSIKSVALLNPAVTVTRGSGGRFNFEQWDTAASTSPAVDLDRLSISGGTLTYADENSGGGFAVENFSLNALNLRIAQGKNAEFLKRLSFAAKFDCRQARVQSFVLSNVECKCVCKNGVFIFDPATFKLFGGKGSGRIEADLAGNVPGYSVLCNLSRFSIEEYFKTLSSNKVLQGPMDFSANLSMLGNTGDELKRSARGDASLTGESLTLYGSDLDREFARFESSQNFSLFDAGAYFFVGPLGLLVTKGYNFANVIKGGGGESVIGKLFSGWKIDNGSALAGDVAFSTKKNRVALKGKINFASERFDDVTIAIIDAKGCAKIKQKVHGSFRKPVADKPDILVSLAGPAINLFKKGRNIFAGGKCEVFYAGSVPAPK